jgi:hypothetical protein
MDNSGAGQESDEAIIIGKAGSIPMMQAIRPKWRNSRLIQRVEELMAVDRSSACQKILNAAFKDLKEKIVVMGVDIAKEVAKEYQLPVPANQDAILDYNTARTIDLAYRMGLLTKPEYKRIKRAYEIRRDLEHDDDEYEATDEDVIYIFKTAIEIVLSKDPVELLEVNDIKRLVESSNQLNLSQEIIEDYCRIPPLRQKEIMSYLVSVAKSGSQPEIVRRNSFKAMTIFAAQTQETVKMQLANWLESPLGRERLDKLTAKIGIASGAFPYFKSAKQRDFFATLLESIKSSKEDFYKEGVAACNLEEVGGLRYCPRELLSEFVKELVFIYVGQPGGYGYFGRNRMVFYSDSAAPVIETIFTDSRKAVAEVMPQVIKDEIVAYCSSRSEHTQRRMNTLASMVGVAIPA